MTLSNRMRKIREIRGWKQSAIAISLNISQQSYSVLEKRAEFAKLETLQRFCDLLNVNISFFLATNIDITEETMATIGTNGFAEICNNYRRVEQKANLLQEMFENMAEGTPLNHTAGKAA